MMRLPKMDYIAPTTVKEACTLLDRHGPEARVLAGGTDLLVALKLRNMRPALLLGLGGIPDLKGIDFEDGEDLKIGAMASLNDVRYDAYISEHYPALSQAAAAVGTRQLQYMGTLGGNLCLNTRCIYYNQSDGWRRSREVCFKMGGEVCHVVPKGKKCFAVFSGDTVPALMALDAEVKLAGSTGERRVPVQALYTGDGKAPLSLGADELVTEIRVPQAVGRQSSTYLKYRIRDAIDFPLVGVAVRMDSDGDGICTDCKVVLNAVGSAPAEVPESGALLKGQVITEELIRDASEQAMKGAHPVGNTAGSTPHYRRRMAGILARRALHSTANSLGLI